MKLQKLGYILAFIKMNKPFMHPHIKKYPEEFWKNRLRLVLNIIMTVFLALV
jgi:hypothetical protein